MADAAVSLSDAQIDELLNQAETRLLSKQQQGQHSTSTIAHINTDVVTNAPTKTLAAKSGSSASNIKKGQQISVRVPQVRKSKKEMKAENEANAGAQWFNLPATDLTPQLRRDLQLLKMRDVLDPKRHYKKDSTRPIPAFSAVGTILPGPTDYFNARMTKKERKRTLLEDVLETEDSTRRFKSKYGEIQAVKTSGKKGHYKKTMQKRYGRNYKG
ncbi:Fcf2-domain-containing protein [Xylariaceae sp. FL1651]|nr:Fcf2-domain-containing protein [Xylariaceae sp. FL1651]